MISPAVRKHIVFACMFSHACVISQYGNAKQFLHVAKVDEVLSFDALGTEVGRFATDGFTRFLAGDRLGHVYSVELITSSRDPDGLFRQQIKKNNF